MPERKTVLELSFKLETNRAVPAERALAIADGILSIARREDLLGPEAFIEIEHLGRGSFWARFRIHLYDAAAAATIVTLLVAAIELVLVEGADPLAETVAHACLESDAAACRIKSGDTEIVIERGQMPLVARIKAMRRQDASDSSILTTEDGDPIVTETGEPLETRSVRGSAEDANPPIRTTEDGELRATEDGALRASESEVGDADRRWRSVPPPKIGDTVHLAGQFTENSGIVQEFKSMSGKRYPITNHVDRRALPAGIPVRIKGLLRRGYPEPAIELQEWSRLDEL